MKEPRTQNPEPRMAAKRFENLLVWQKAHASVLSIYRVTDRFPEEERYGLKSQLRRSAASVPANISEAFKKRGKDKARFLNIVQSSLEETRYHVIPARDLKYLPSRDLLPLVDKVSRRLDAYTRKILGSVSCVLGSSET